MTHRLVATVPHQKRALVVPLEECRFYRFGKTRQLIAFLAECKTVYQQVRQTLGAPLSIVGNINKLAIGIYHARKALLCVNLQLRAQVAPIRQHYRSDNGSPAAIGI